MYSSLLAPTSMRGQKRPTVAGRPLSLWSACTGAGTWTCSGKASCSGSLSAPQRPLFGYHPANSGVNLHPSACPLFTANMFAYRSRSRRGVMAVSTAASTSYFSTGRFSNWWNGVLGDNLWATPTHVRHQIDMDPVAGVKKLDVMGFIQDQLNRDGGKYVGAVVAANVAVFLVWKIPNHRVFAFMCKNFMSNANLVRSGRVWTLLTSNYSHRGLLHLGLNMFAVAHFSPEIIHTGPSRYQLEFSPNEWLAMYTLAGIAGAATSAVWGVLQATPFIPSLGASAAGFAVLAFYMLEYPKSKLYVMGVPMTCEQAFTLTLLVHGGGVIWSFFRHVGVDFMAHLGGIVIGMLAHQQAKQRHQKKRGSFPWPW